MANGVHKILLFIKYLDLKCNLNVLYVILHFLDKYFYINLENGEKKYIIYITLMKIKVLLCDGDTFIFYFALVFIRDLQPFTFKGHINKFLKFHGHPISQLNSII